MATRDVAIDILKAAVQGGAKPGEMLRPDMLKSADPVPKIADFELAMNFVVEQGWVEKLGPDQFRLTDAGYAVATA
jgi:hypothetical protein